jgi:hypothetical protein
MDKVHKPSDSECYTPPSEPIKFHKDTGIFALLTKLTNLPNLLTKLTN